MISISLRLKKIVVKRIKIENKYFTWLLTLNLLFSKLDISNIINKIKNDWKKYKDIYFFLFGVESK